MPENSPTQSPAEPEGSARQVLVLVGLLILLAIAYYAISKLTAGRPTATPATPAQKAPKGFSIGESALRTQLSEQLPEAAQVERVLFSDAGEKILVLARQPDDTELEIILKRDEFGRYVDAHGKFKVYP